jgi:hypothetical protein
MTSTDPEAATSEAEVAASLLIGYDRSITPAAGPVTAGAGADEKWRRQWSE